MHVPTRAYRHASNFPRAQRRAQARLLAAPPTLRARLANCIPSAKTADLAGFERHITAFLGVCDDARAVYSSKAARADELRVRRAREREWHRLVQLLAYGHTTVSGRWHQQGQPHRAAPHPRPQLVILGWGNASTGHGSGISRPGLPPVRAFERFVHANYPDICFIRLDEYCTSKVCTVCWSTAHKHGLQIRGAPSHKVRVCQNHARPLVVDRDASAAAAMMAVLVGDLFGSPSDQLAWHRRAAAGGQN